MHEGAGEDGQGEAHGGGGRREQQEGGREAHGIDPRGVVAEPPQNRHEAETRRGKQKDDESAAKAHRHLEPGVGPDRTGEAGATAGGDGITERKPGHEAREHETRSPHAVAEGQAGLTEPEVLEDEGGRTRQEEDTAQGRPHAG